MLDKLSDDEQKEESDQESHSDSKEHKEEDDQNMIAQKSVKKSQVESELKKQKTLQTPSSKIDKMRLIDSSSHVKGYDEAEKEGKLILDKLFKKGIFSTKKK